MSSRLQKSADVAALQAAAKIIPLPGAAIEPVIQTRTHRGPYPANVVAGWRVERRRRAVDRAKRTAAAMPADSAPAPQPDRPMHSLMHFLGYNHALINMLSSSEMERIIVYISTIIDQRQRSGPNV